MPRTPKNQDVEEAMPPKTSRERRAAEAKLAVSLIAQVPPLKTSTTNSGFPRWQSAILDVAYNQGWDDAILSAEDWDPEEKEDELEESDRRVAWMVLKATTQEFSYLLTAVRRGDASAVFKRIVNHFERPTTGSLVSKLGSFFQATMLEYKMGVKEFGNKIHEDARVLKQLGSPVTDTQMTVVFLKGLVPELDTVKDAIMHEDVDKLKFQAVVDKVYDYALNKGLDTATTASTTGRAATFFNSTTTTPGYKKPTYTPKGDEGRMPLQKDLGLRNVPCKFHARGQCQFAYNDKLCPYSHKLAEQQRNSNGPPTDTERENKKMKCYSCGKTGHLKHQCRNKERHVHFNEADLIEEDEEEERYQDSDDFASTSSWP